MAAEDPEACQVPENETISNETVKELCTELDQSQQNVSDLKTDNANLRGEISDLEERVESLEYQANNAEGFPNWMAEDMREMGAYDPYQNEPAFMIMQNSQILIYVGEENGEHSPNGLNAWDTFLTFEEAGTTNITISDQYYVRDGMQDEWTIKTGFNSEGQKAKLERLVNQFNHPRTFFAYSEWNNQKRQQKENFRTQSLVGGLLALIGMLYAGIWIESENDIRKDRKKARKSRNAVKWGMGYESEGKVRSIKRRLLKPIRRLLDRLRGDGK